MRKERNWEPERENPGGSIPPGETGSQRFWRGFKEGFFWAAALEVSVIGGIIGGLVFGRYRFNI